MNNLISFLRSLELFSSLDEKSLQAISADLEYLAIAEGESLFQQGDESDALYIVVTGRMEATVLGHGDEIAVGQIEAGEMIGEIQVLSGGSRTASVSALCDVELLKMPRERFQHVLSIHPEILPKINEVILRRLRLSRLVTILAEVFDMHETAITEIEKYGQWRHLQQGDLLLRQEEIGDSFYIVISGLLQTVFVDENGSERFINELVPGETVGEMAILTEERRSANVYAIRESDVVEFSRQAYERISQTFPQFRRNITRRIISRLRKTIETPSDFHRSLSIALVPVSADVPLSDFAHRLAQALSAYAPALHVNDKRVNNLMGMAGISQTDRDNPYSLMLSTWLNEQENTYRYLVYETAPFVSPWTSRCFEHADQIVVVGRAAHAPAPDDIDVDLLQREPLSARLHKTLVLLHPDENHPPAGTARWLTAKHADIHHHLRWNTEADFGRLARFLSGKAIGLVLGGGGARGFAHIGIIRALEEAKIPIDMICGVSMGAILAALYAMGYDAQTMLKLTHQGVVESHLEWDFTLPFIAMMSGRKFKKVLHSFYQERRIEDLWLNYFSVACNLSTAEAVTLRRGFLWKAVQTSNVAPGIFPPALDNGNLLVDGGIVNNQPGDIMKELCGGPVIVVNVSAEREMTVDPSYTEMPSAWKMLWSRMNPFQQAIQVPNIPAMIMRTILVGSYRKSREVEMNADFYLRPPLDQFKLHDYAKIAKIAEIGYQYAKEQITTWDKRYSGRL